MGTSMKSTNLLVNLTNGNSKELASRSLTKIPSTTFDEFLKEGFLTATPSRKIVLRIVEDGDVIIDSGKPHTPGDSYRRAAIREGALDLTYSKSMTNSSNAPGGLYELGL
eukprot:TRINITY_DN9893_c0_g1_i2.p1 TRINITY_DN9893_c0_g1~~TRINITY_DN9893_c0_g1_i2.p1  ORF type:complete len:110 (-),score=10.92 TRINITY_DN9893_c0_g1_i2:28-357(-)